GGRGWGRLDFTIGDERYKLEWSDHTIRLYDYIAPASPRGWLMSALILTRRRLARLIKQNPLLWNAFGRMRAMVGSRRAGNEDRAASAKSPPIPPARPRGRNPNSIGIAAGQSMGRLALALALG